MKRIKKLSATQVGDAAACAIGAWCISALFLTLLTAVSPTNTAYASEAPLLPFLICFLVLWGITAYLSLRLPLAPPFLFASLLLYGCAALYRKSDFYIYLVIAFVFAISIVYLLNRVPDFGELPIRLSRRWMLGLIISIGAILFSGLIILLLCRYYSYSSPCYDFGIFSQMFYYMAETGEPLTTCERDGLLSHFAVHVSPIFYLYLPFYAMIPSPATLIVMQAIFLFSGAVPLVLLARRLSLSRVLTVVLAVLYFAYPAMIGGCFYDLHENKLLLPLLLWVFYFLETKRYPAVYLFAVLVLLVKEDAPIYIAFVALYWLAARPRKRHAVVLLLLSVLYFMGAVWYLETYGDGAMFGRYQNLIGYEGTPMDLLRTALLNPSLILRELLDEEKLAFLAYMLLPLGLLPVMTKHLSRLILLLPMVLINLMPDYYYQHNIGYQYTYGVAAMLFYLLILNLPELKGKLRRGLLLFAICATLLLTSMRLPGQIFYLQRATTYREDNAKITECLSQIPDDVSVRASTMFIPHLSAREELYVIESLHDSEFVALDLRPYINAHVNGITVEYFEARGYQVILYEEELLAILQLPT